MVGVAYPCTWGGQAVFLTGGTILQVPLPAVNQALGSHWPLELHLGNGALPWFPTARTVMVLHRWSDQPLPISVEAPQGSCAHDVPQQLP